MSTIDDQNAISAGEVASVCAHYDLGLVREVRPLGRGSRRSGKIALGTSTGWYLLKRRGGTQADPRRVALSHDVQLYLRGAGYPVPEIVGTRGEGNSMLQIADRVYEVFRFVPGGAYDASPAATAAAGRALAEYHRLLRGFSPRWTAPAHGYHALPGLSAALEAAARRAGVSPSERSAARELSRLYDAAAREVTRLGAVGINRQLVHGDWHPGNLLFSGGEVRAVVDHDAVGTGARVMDLAYGLLHFSLNRVRMRWAGEGSLMGSENPDEGRIAAFASGYHQRSDPPLSGVEAAAAPWLMIEAAAADAAGAVSGLRGAGVAAGKNVEAGGIASGLLSAIADMATRIADGAGRISRAIAGAPGGTG